MIYWRLLICIEGVIPKFQRIRRKICLLKNSDSSCRFLPKPKYETTKHNKQPSHHTIQDNPVLWHSHLRMKWLARIIAAIYLLFGIYSVGSSRIWIMNRNFSLVVDQCVATWNKNTSNPWLLSLIRRAFAELRANCIRNFHLILLLFWFT